MKLKITKLILFISFALVIASCDKETSLTADSAQIEVSSYSPAAGAAKTEVTILGKGFDQEKIRVYFNGTQARIKLAEAGKLVVLVPVAAGTGPVTIVSGEETTTIGNFEAAEAKVTVSTLAGCGDAGFLDASAKFARFDQPSGIAVAKNGTVYVADQANNRIRKITTNGVVSTFAGSGKAGYKDGKGTAAQFNFPVGIAIDDAGVMYVADFVNNRIRKILPNGTVSTLAGDGEPGYTDGPGATAQFSSPIGIGINKTSGNLYVTDLDNNVIRKIEPNGNVSTVAGNGNAGTADGDAFNAEFFGPNGIAVSADGTLYIAEEGNHNIRKITTGGAVSTMAGNGQPGYTNGAGILAQFTSPNGIAVDENGTVYVADWFNNRIRRISQSGMVSTLAGSGGRGFGGGFADGDGKSAQFNLPRGIAVDDKGVLFVADQLNNRIRKIVVE